ncbi:PREDICTED: phosphatidylinositol 4-phosphate 5-kinase 1-like [Ceratosolen solmsi marchali]|uniref:Phosphatidylinositol 4-phosphate 5-kinase 1-like n=1 Tax=Ceratosolen solmsi marchali TaxID=326594 RepID=A0AAJ6YGK2_9HYME|nr:PREDICTED: phosphatidylinositol 4-phosphate 5-kinase 1-like [Ceratosolen solmsi marchali]
MQKVKKKAKKLAEDTSKVNKEIRYGKDKFNFTNGDSYEGEYIVINNEEIYRHGYGVYKTSDLDEYRALWDYDCIASDAHIIYSNSAEYKGEFNNEGAMNGKGVYIFPDGSSLNATWKDNLPIADFIYKDPLGYNWQGNESLDKEMVVFTPENYVCREDYN